MSDHPPKLWAPSLWRHIAASDADAPIGSGALAQDLCVEVAVVGAGYSGLSAAHELQRRGVECAVLDANPVGWAASGRNGGVVSPKFRQSFSQIARAHGIATVDRMHRLAHESIRAVERVVDEYGLASAQFELNGSMQCAHTERALADIRGEAEWLRTYLGDTTSRGLSREQIAEETGSSAFVGGVLSTDAGTILPLAYVRGLARGIASRGVPIHECSPVLDIMRAPGDASVTLRTPAAVVRAKQVIIATDAYSMLTPATDAWRRVIVPFRSAIIATEPLTPELDARILARNRSYTETRRMMKWFRKADGRMLFGGRDAFGRDGQQTGFEALQRAMAALFPDLADLRIDFRWSGYVSLTLDGLPHVGRSDASTVYCVGYNGTGIAMASLIGQHAAALALGERPDLALLQRDGLRPIPCYPLAEPGVRMVAGYYQLLDAVGA